MIGYLTSVSQASGNPDFDWQPYLQQSQDNHKGVYGIPWVSDRSNWAAATNDVLARAGMPQYAIPQEQVGQIEAYIQDVQSQMGSQWLKGPGPWMLATVITAGLAGPAAAGAAAAESGGAAAAAGAMGGAAGAAGGGLTLAEAAGGAAAFGGGAAGAGGLVGGEAAGAYGAGEFGTGLAQGGYLGGAGAGGLEQIVTELAKKVGMDAAKALVTQAVSGGGGGSGGTGPAGGAGSGINGNNLVDLINSILTGRQAGKAEDSQRALLQQAIDSDLWRPQQGRYFEPLHDTVTKGVGNTPYGQSLIESTLRELSARGGNPWGQGSTPGEVAKVLDRGTNERATMLTPLAMGRMPNQAIFGQMAPGITASQTGQNRAIGGGLEAIFGQKGMFPAGPIIDSAWEGLFGNGGMFRSEGPTWNTNTPDYTNDMENWGYL
jgi:hypothetical protein